MPHLGAVRLEDKWGGSVSPTFGLGISRVGCSGVPLWVRRSKANSVAEKVAEAVLGSTSLVSGESS